MKYSKRLLPFLLLVSITAQLFSEEVGYITYKGNPTNIDGSVITVPSNTVALSDYLYLDEPDTVGGSNGTAMFFIVDNSGSMDSKNNDENGNRFWVIDQLIDSMSSLDDVWMGIGLYQSELSYKSSLPYIAEVPEIAAAGRDAGYLPLIKIDSLYPNLFTGSGSIMGSEIVRYYIQTEIINGVTMIDQDLIDNSPRGTNTNYGVRAMKDAMRNTDVLRKNQYGIFLTDGEPTTSYSPDGGNKDFQSYDSVNTTYTLFFTGGTSVPTSVSAFTSNVASQTYYSSSNPKSEAWPFNNGAASPQELLAFLMTNIIDGIIGDIVSAPAEVIINGKTSGVTWDPLTGTARLDGPTPLTGPSTPIYMILYNVTEYDSIGNGGDTINVRDTVIDTVSYTVVIDPAMTVVADTLEQVLWDRDFEARQGGIAVSPITNSANNVEINFTFDPMTSGYDYSTRTTLSVTAVTTISRDTISLTLTKQADNRFAVSVPRTTVYANGATAGNGTLEHYGSDNLILTYINNEDPVLPLDILIDTIQIRTFSENSFNSSGAQLFDDNADGNPDRLLIPASGTNLAALQVPLFSALVFPAIYTANLPGITLSGSNFTVPVTTSSNTKTSVNGSDILVLSDTLFLTPETIFLPTTINMVDSMAPIVIDASVDNSVLTVTFSESVTTASIPGNPFLFVDNSGVAYTPTLSRTSHVGNTAVYTVSGTPIEVNDSLHFKFSGSPVASDAIGNSQDNSVNRKVPILVAFDYTLTAAAMYDGNANGLPDELVVTVNIGSNGDFISQLAGSIANMLSVGGGNFSIGTGTRVGSTNRISLPITYSGGGFKTSLVVSENLVVNGTGFGSGGTLVDTTIAITDSMGPVITAAALLDNGTAEVLTLTISEPIENIAANSLSFIRNGGGTFTKSSTQTSNSGTTLVMTLTGASVIATNDSVYFTVNRATDVVGIDQDNSANKRVPIIVSRPHVVSEVSVFDTDADGYPDELTVVANGALLSDFANALRTLGTITGGELAISGAATISGNTLTYPLTYSGGVRRTDINNNEEFVIAAGTFGTNGSVAQDTVSMTDSMGPVIIQASLVDTAGEVLTLTFSEDMSNIIDANPFNFVTKTSSVIYVRSVSQIGLTLNTLSFDVTGTGQTIIHDDSIFINVTAGSVTDANNITQSVSANLRTPIKVQRFRNIISAALFDSEGDGFPDKISLGMDPLLTDSLIKADLSTGIHSLISFQNGNSTRFTLASTPGTYVTKGGNLFLDLDIVYSSTEYMTSLTTESVVVAFGNFGPNGGNLYDTTLAIVDSMGAIVTTASLVDSAGEILTVSFSEPITAIATSFTEPFNYYKTYLKGATPYIINYQAEVTQIGSFGNDIAFRVDNVIGLDTILIAGDTLTDRNLIELGDSLDINVSFTTKVTDQQGVEQLHFPNNRVPIIVQRIHTVDSTALYDVNADGYPDLLVLNTSGVLTANLSEILETNISLPTFLSVVPGGGTIQGSRIAIQVQYNGTEARTWLNGEDVVVSSEIFTGGGLLIAGSVDITDSMAPVAVSARLTDSTNLTPTTPGDEVLVVTFSEDVNPISGTTPFNFIDGLTSTEYAVTLGSPVVVTPRIVQFTVTNTPTIVAGDSLYIDSLAVEDILSLAQGNMANVRVPLTVLRSHQLLKAAMFDTSGSGEPDMMTVKVTGIFSDTLADNLDSVLSLPAFVTIDAGTGVYNPLDSLITFGVTYVGTSPRTHIQGDQVIALNLPFGQSGLLIANSVLIEDSMAPVIIASSIETDTLGNSKLTVLFSENVDNVNRTEPYTFVKEGIGTEFTAELALTSPATIGSFFEYNVGLISGGFDIVEGDSIYIVTTDAGGTVTDTVGNGQLNPNNKRVPLTAVLFHVIQDGYLYDRDGNGFPDEVSFGAQGVVLDSLTNHIMELVDLPNGITFDLAGSARLDGQRIYAPVLYTGTALKTNTGATDLYDVTNAYSNPLGAGFVDGAYLLPSTAQIIDSMAPVVASAQLLDSLYYRYSDEISVTFSEPVTSFSHSQPFEFERVDGTTYSAWLTLLDDTTSATTKVFTVDTLLGATSIVATDSVRIKTDGTNTVADILTIGQWVNSNRLAPITIDSVHEYIEILNISFYDDASDGKVDRVGVMMTGQFIRDNYDEIYQSLLLPTGRSMTVDSSLIIDSTIMIRVASVEERTSISSTDSVGVNNNSDSGYVLPSGLTVKFNTVEPYDSMAPVILSAHMIDSVTVGKVNELRVTFSEAVVLPNTTSEYPFRFIRPDSTNQFSMHVVNQDSTFYVNEAGDTISSYYEPVLEEPNVILYHVDAVVGVDHAQDGDSIWVNVSDLDPVQDSTGNQQLNSANVRRVMIVDYVTDPFSLVFFGTFMDEQGPGVKASLIALGLDELTNQLLSASDTFMVFGITPNPKESFFVYDSLSGSARIFDPVGNLIYSGIELSFDRQGKQTLAIWNGKNRNGRTVGTGSYLAVVEVVYYRRGRRYSSFNVSSRIMVGPSHAKNN